MSLILISMKKKYPYQNSAVQQQYVKTLLVKIYIFQAILYEKTYVFTQIMVYYYLKCILNKTKQLHVLISPLKNYYQQQLKMANIFQLILIKKPQIKKKNILSVQNSKKKLQQMPKQKQLNIYKKKAKKVQGNGLAFQTKNNLFFYVQNLMDPHVMEFINPLITDQIPCWIVIPSEYTLSEKIELQIPNVNNLGIISIAENDQKTLFFSTGQPTTLQNIIQMASSPRNKYVAYLTFQKESIWTLHVISSDFETYNSIEIDLNSEYQQELEQIQKQTEQQIEIKGNNQIQQQQYSEKTNIQKKKVQIKMMWCGEDCLIIHIRNSLFLIEQKAQFEDENQSSFFCLQEIDGIKIISLNKNQILRLSPSSYINIFQPFSNHPAALLFQSYKSLQNRDPLREQDIRNNKEQLLQAVQDCIEASGYELNNNVQLLLLRAASYGKMFLPQNTLDPGLITDICRNLRVTHALQNVNRTITCFQLKNIKQEILIKVLLRYNYHYLSSEICRHLHFPPKLKSYIYVHWACCKVMTNEPDEILAQIIYNKIKQENSIQFTEIADKALECGKPLLALKLLEFEPCIQKKIPFLLWMGSNCPQEQLTGYFEKALDESIKSRDSNLIYLVLMKIWNSDGQNKFDQIKKHQISSIHFVNYLKIFHQDDASIQNFLINSKEYIKAGFFNLLKFFNTNDQSKKQELLKQIITLFGQESQDPFYSKMIKQYNILYTQFMQGQNWNQISINQFYQQSVSTQQEKIELKLKKEFSISEKRQGFAKIQSYIEKNNIEDIELVLENINKKKIIVPYDLVADILIKKGHENIAYNVIQKINNVEEIVQILLRLGQTKRAIQSAIQFRNTTVLLDIRNQINDQELITVIDQYLNNPNQ
ncbi:vacuolar sorting protein, putative [Ichthyophthirius multifiliis]|uniref:Vacuolar sorting protein, putative n=1 Tax=Ichthyophthirius multifiliis TaxID=5932 RepID=G0QSJ0_ICHMU|nr:vacuolar sorting protein, putative [Ichthyophthirius multifiliis]EGR31828.1 vacuolar sorting protein, putative [Ichthyophthirius multifiliis]|eukprot:XP_004035314.1 vacuolar sorting protein, putative [Ichthyophthirius multifiliis]